MVVELQQSINQVPEDTRPLLDMAAVIGNRIDEKLLYRLAPGADLPVWLAICEQAGVMTPDDGGWRFRNERVRHCVLDELADNPDLLGALHARVALAIKDVYTGDIRWLPVAADHWRQADEVTQQAITLVEAGRVALNHSLTQALAFIEEAESHDPHRDDIPRTEHIERALIRGEALAGLSRWQAARTQFEQVMNLVDIAQWFPEDWPYTRENYRYQRREQIRHRMLLLFYLESRDDPPPEPALFTALRFLAEICAALNQPRQSFYYALTYTNLAEVYPASVAFTPGVGYALLARLFRKPGYGRFAEHYRHLAQEDMLRCDPGHHPLIMRLLDCT